MDIRKSLKVKLNVLSLQEKCYRRSNNKEKKSFKMLTNNISSKLFIFPFNPQVLDGQDQVGRNAGLQEVNSVNEHVEGAELKHGRTWMRMTCDSN